ncbi:MAG TPA: polyketide synthase, partial [Saliniramus sp.]|nr:polyketide synthase [Saliniramus sp.]
MNSSMDAVSRTESAGSDPIAVIGIGCRFAGGVTCPETLWLMLQEGRDGVVPVPPERWNASRWYDPDRHHPGTMNFRQAGFLQERIDQFDAAFFGIAPREAQMMDPQQRLFLEVAFEALEDAGIRSDALAQTRTGIFTGVYNGNYTMMARGAPDASAINGWSATGGHASIVAGRLAYFLGTTGPALAVDTACSSSLVAVHLAVQSLRSGECEMALVGGVHLLTAPEPLVASTKLGATSPDGRCKVFDAAADGFGHGEGAGVIVLKRLSEATAAGDRIIAVIRGTAVNQDGRSNSLTAPNGPSQAQVITRALRDAGVGPSQISYVEAHGTATPLGDPIEVEAIGDALGAQRERPLLIGSVKSNLGHTEAAAGIAGLIKAILVAQKCIAPPQAGFETLNPEIAALDLPISIPKAQTELAGVDGRRIVGVSAFGFS